MECCIIRSQVLHCSPVWRLRLIKDIKKLEQLQRRATKYILNDYLFDYKTRLTYLSLLPLMYIFEISNILFFIKNLKNPPNNFNIDTYISFSIGITGLSYFFYFCGFIMQTRACINGQWVS